MTDVRVKSFYRTCPCNGCVAPNRHPGCHSNCKEKSDWDLEKDQLMEKIRKEKKKDYEATGFLVDSQRKMAKALQLNKWK